MSGRTNRVLLVIAILLGAALLVTVPVWFFQRNPPVTQEVQWDTPQTRALAQRACIDCHSNSTTWPLYSRIPPISWLVTLDVIRGRRHLNFSEGGGVRGEGRERGGDVGEVVSNGSMPPAIYLIEHPDARLNDVEKRQLIQGLRATLQ